MYDYGNDYYNNDTNDNKNNNNTNNNYDNNSDSKLNLIKYGKHYWKNRENYFKKKLWRKWEIKFIIIEVEKIKIEFTKIILILSIVTICGFWIISPYDI